MKVLRFMRMYNNISLQLMKNILKLRNKCESTANLEGKVVIITGAHTGIVKETAFQLSLRGAKVIMACRDLKKAEIAMNEILKKNTNANIAVMKLDLSSLKDVRDFAEKVCEQEKSIDILINNAGIMMCPHMETEDGYEKQFGTNYLGHFLLTMLLLNKMKESSNARVINVSSTAHMAGKIYFDDINLRNGKYTPIKAYCQSKLANILFTRELAKRLGPNSNVTVYSLHPGIIRTELFRDFSPVYKLFNNMIKPIYIKPKLGVQTTLYCALEESLQYESGFYYDDCRRIDKMISKASDDECGRKLWELSCDLIAIKYDLRFKDHFEECFITRL